MTTVSVGDELPDLTKLTTTRQLVQYAGAQGDFFEIHYDADFARGAGLPGVIVHGLLKAAFLGQLVTTWLGERGTIKKFEVSYRDIDVPGPYRCRGRIVSVNHLELVVEVWGEAPDGHRTTVGQATVQMLG